LYLRGTGGRAHRAVMCRGGRYPASTYPARRAIDAHPTPSWCRNNGRSRGADWCIIMRQADMENCSGWSSWGVRSPRRRHRSSARAEGDACARPRSGATGRGIAFVDVKDGTIDIRCELAREATNRRETSGFATELAAARVRCGSTCGAVLQWRRVRSRLIGSLLRPTIEECWGRSSSSSSANENRRR
jgi:hypothetical protein